MDENKNLVHEITVSYHTPMKSSFLKKNMFSIPSSLMLWYKRTTFVKVFKDTPGHEARWVASEPPLLGAGDPLRAARLTSGKVFGRLSLVNNFCASTCHTSDEHFETHCHQGAKNGRLTSVRVETFASENWIKFTSKFNFQTKNLNFKPKIPMFFRVGALDISRWTSGKQ